MLNSLLDQVKIRTVFYMQIEASNNSFSVWVADYKSASWNFMLVDEYFVVVEN